MVVKPEFIVKVKFSSTESIDIFRIVFLNDEGSK